jgi:hypothetical protein
LKPLKSRYYMKKFNLNVVPYICAGIMCLLSACQKDLGTAPKTSNKNDELTAVVTTVAGNDIGGNAIGGNTDGTGTAATFYQPFGITLDAQGNFYIADTKMGLIRKMTSSFTVTTLAGKGTSGYTDGTGNAAAFELPYGVVADASGNLYVTDTYNAVIRKVTPAGVVSTFAGNAAGGGKDTYVDGTGTAATFQLPWGIAIDATGNLFVADKNAVRKITPAGVVTTFAGSAVKGSANGTGPAAGFFSLSGIAVDSQNNVYVEDQGNYMIRKITADGVVSTLAGNGTKGAANGGASTASFNYPTGMTIDTHGNLFITDNNLVRKVASDGTVSTIAGDVTETILPGTDGVGAAAAFFWPRGITVDANGNLFVLDTMDNLVRKITFHN